ncbi:hypothetical protein CCR94_05640 [Rhodoblastus sphagnicola]|uniref:DUF2202 domain-containing protein n=1 Tax=Rhodoblastus sphagnicola TaxID=333368 RepID=A0A2S6NCU7_9HYPH|nr:hypothetical protein [Rhodoblastus sphagnicola]MBB4196309.1 hypothetical protein [Rhodoblastus sphagnicola]PPQ32450.1 hypothetical protein CCR94_05640 [Rhodoblastus sphagnicola]
MNSLYHDSRLRALVAAFHRIARAKASMEAPMQCGHAGGEGWWGCKADGGCAPILAAACEKLSGEARQAVVTALDDEYRAQAFYRAVLRKFPHALPFSRFVEAEARHAAALTGILDAYGLEAPPNVHIDSAEISASAPATLAGACEAAAAAEIRNDRLYAEVLLPMVAAYPLIAAIFERLMLTSRECHLPAFRCFAEAYRMERPLEEAQV